MSTRDTAGAADEACAGLIVRPVAVEAIEAPQARFDVVCYDADGNEKWRDFGHNVVTLEGKTLCLNSFFRNTAPPTTWYILLAGAGTKAATDTLATHAGWTEMVPGTAYTGNRPAVTFSAASTVSSTGAQVTHGSPVAFAITATNTIAGAGICTAATGTSGTLWNIVDFSGGSRAVVSGDTLNVTITESFAA